jgi:hypothetical protein
LADPVSTFERRLDALEKRIGRCPNCQDRPVIRIFVEDDETGEMRLDREDPQCQYCGSPNQMNIHLVYDDVVPAGGVTTKGENNGLG